MKYYKNITAVIQNISPENYFRDFRIVDKIRQETNFSYNKFQI